MFDSLTIEAILDQSLQVAGWAYSQLSQMREAAMRLVWDTSPWWFKIMIVAVTINGAYLALRRWTRALTR